MIEKEQKGKVVYSDGEETEKNFLELVQNFSEEEIREKIKDDGRYLINNTFSPVRRNLLEWYPFRQGCSILEIGAGMGSLTKLLCEKAAQVTAVEMNEIRAEIIRARCKEVDNLTVTCENVVTWETEKKFDYVIMVGVLEYAAIFSSSSTAHADFLKKASSFLKPDGVLLLAIENRFGLRYWLGSAEDHIGKPFVGIQGYHQPKTAKTFSKHQLEKLLEEQGLESRFYYLLPDYKFPTAIFTDEALPSFHDIYNVAFAYGRNSCLTANERELYRDLINDGVFPFFANSFLVEAAVSLPQKHIIRVNGRSEVRKENRILTIIDNDGRVSKIPQNNDAKEHLRRCHENEQRISRRGVKCLNATFDGEKIVSDFCHCQMANTVFNKAICEGDRAGAFGILEKLKKALEKSSNYTGISQCNPALKEIPGWESEFDVLEHGYIDMSFYNSFWVDDELVFFDQEWDFPGLPLKFLLYYNVKVCYQRADSVPQIPLSTLCAYIDVSQEQAARYDILEEKLWASCAGRTGDIYGADGYYNRYGVETFEELSQKLDFTRQEIEKGKRERAKIQQEKELLYGEFLAIQEKSNQLQGSLTCREGECQQLRDKENRYLNELAALKQEKANTYGEVLQLRDKENQLKNALANKETEYQQLQYELACREGECQQLRDKENRFLNDQAAINSSRSWRIAQCFRRVVRFFVPTGSKRAVFCRLLWTMVRHPGIFLKNLSARNIKKFLRLLKRGQMEDIRQLIKKNVTGLPVPPLVEAMVPEIVPVDIEAIQNRTAADYPVLTVPQWENPAVSIIIPVYNQFEYTYHCVESILKNSGDVSFEILIANDCSTDLTTEIEQIIPGVRCITTEKNLRFLLNCNNAAKYAKGKYLLFLNNDTQVQDNWLEPLVTLIESAEDIGMVGSKLIYPDGLLQEAGGILWRDGSAWNYGNRQNAALPEFNYVKQVDYISGAAIMLYRSLWEEIGGFDEQFAPAYCEDSDLAFTVRKMGYRVMYQPKSVVVHFEGISNGTDTSSGQKQYQILNSKKFYEKWKDELAKHPENGENVFQARDRSYDRKTLLMVDHYVPQYDKDAGSRTVFQYLKLFVSLGFQVKFIGDNFYQHEPYTSVLQQMGIEVLYGPDCAAHWLDWIRDNGEHIDYAFLNRPHIAPRYMDAVRKYTHAKVVYYGHDLGFLREMREYEVTGDIAFKESSQEWQPKELALMRKADMAYYPSYVEVDEIHAIDPSIRVKAIPAYLFDEVKWEGYAFDSRKDIMFIGGFGHRPNVDAVKWLAKEIYPELAKLLPDVKIHILGSNAPQEVLELASENFIIDGFVTDEQLMEFYRTCRISIVPLRYGAGIKGKVVEAMRYGTPVVTTTTGAEGIPNAEAAMLIEDDAKMLAQKLAQLYMDSEKLTQMSQNCVAYVQNNYSFANAIKVIGPEFDLKG